MDYDRAKHAAKLAIFNAKNAERLKLCEELEDEDRNGNVFRVAKQLVRKNRDVVGVGCVKDNVGKIVVEEDKLLEFWKEHFDRISNEEFSWGREGLTNVRPVFGPGEKISEEEVEAAIGKIKLGKAGGPSSVVADMLKAAGDKGTTFLSGSRLHRSFCDTRSETGAICHLRAAVHSKNQNSDIWTEVIQGLWSNNLE